MRVVSPNTYFLSVFWIPSIRAVHQRVLTRVVHILRVDGSERGREGGGEQVDFALGIA